MWRLLAAFILLALTACGPQPDAKTVVDVFLSARDAGDIDGAMSVVAPNVTMRAPNELVYEGPDQVRQWLQATLVEYVYNVSEGPTITTPNDVTWHDNLYSQDGARWVGEIEWQAGVSDLKIATIRGRVIRGASGIICPRCPPGTRI